MGAVTCLLGASRFGVASSSQRIMGGGRCTRAVRSMVWQSTRSTLWLWRWQLAARDHHDFFNSTPFILCSHLTRAYNSSSVMGSRRASQDAMEELFDETEIVVLCNKLLVRCYAALADASAARPGPSPR